MKRWMVLALLCAGCGWYIQPPYEREASADGGGSSDTVVAVDVADTVDTATDTTGDVVDVVVIDAVAVGDVSDTQSEDTRLPYGTVIETDGGGCGPDMLPCNRGIGEFCLVTSRGNRCCNRLSNVCSTTYCPTNRWCGHEIDIYECCRL